MDPPIAARILSDLLAGLHAAHEVRNDHGHPLKVVHRDVSPQNILVGSNGITHLIDFGVAKAAGRVQTTRNGQLKGKLAYMAPEQIRSSHVDRRTDIYAAGLVLWETIVGRRAFEGEDAQLLYAVLTQGVPPPSQLVPGLPPSLDAVIMQAVHKDPSRRFDTAAHMIEALEAAVRPATSSEVARWVRRVGAEAIEKRERLVSDVEGTSFSAGTAADAQSRPDWARDARAATPSDIIDASAFDSKSWIADLAPTTVLAPVAGGPDLPTDTGTTVSSSRIRVGLRTSRLVLVGMASGALLALVAVAILVVALSQHGASQVPAAPSPQTSDMPTDGASALAPVRTPATPVQEPKTAFLAPAAGASSAARSSSPTAPPSPRAAPRPRSTSDKRDERMRDRGW